VRHAVEHQVATSGYTGPNGQRRFRAQCACGWCGDLHVDPIVARVEGRRHVNAEWEQAHRAALGTWVVSV